MAAALVHDAVEPAVFAQHFAHEPLHRRIVAECRERWRDARAPVLLLGGHRLELFGPGGRPGRPWRQVRRARAPCSADARAAPVTSTTRPTNRPGRNAHGTRRRSSHKFMRRINKVPAHPVRHAALQHPRTPSVFCPSPFNFSLLSYTEPGSPSARTMSILARRRKPFGATNPRCRREVFLERPFDDASVPGSPRARGCVEGTIYTISQQARAPRSLLVAFYDRLIADVVAGCAAIVDTRARLNYLIAGTCASRSTIPVSTINRARVARPGRISVPLLELNRR